MSGGQLQGHREHGAALALDARSHVAQYSIAVWPLQQRRYDEAATHARIATELIATDPMSHGLLGSSLLRLERPAVERTTAWLHQFRRLRVRHERRADIYQSFLTLGCILICYRTLDPLFY